MSGSAGRRRTVVQRSLVALQVLLLVASLFAPIGAAAVEPSGDPSPAPSAEPSVEPSVEPTADPTAEPTTEPTAEPTVEPTVEPTTAPVVEPTTAPTTEPSSAPSAPVSAPTISSDLPDYAPGALVTLTGGGWQPGESVHIFVNDDFGSSWSRNADVAADSDGRIVDQFNLPNWFVAVYTAVAVGESGSQAAATFTDGNVNVKTQGAGANQAPIAWIRYGTTNCTGSPVGSPSSGSITAGTSGNGTAVPSGAGATESLRLTAGSIAGHGFVNWTGGGGFVTTAANPLCLQGSGSTQNIQVNYAALTSTSLSVGAATGTFAGSVNLSATLTTGVSGVSGKTVSFTLNGTAVGTAVTNGSGVASLAGASLAGIPAAVYATGVAASFAGDSTFAASNATASLTVNKAASTTVVTCPVSVTFTGSALTPCTVSVTGAGALSLTPTPTYANNTNVGTASASYSYIGDANHNASSDSENFAIAKAASTTVVTCPVSVTFTGSALTPCTVSVTGAGALSLTPTPTYANNTNVGTASASYSYIGDANHNASSDSKTFAITPKGVTITPTSGQSKIFGSVDPTLTYTNDGGLVAADFTGALARAAGENVGTYAINLGTLSAGTNYTLSLSATPVTFAVGQATSTTVVTFEAGPYVYRGTEFTATAVVTGAGGLNQSVPVVLSGDCTNVTTTDGCTATATFAGDTNHTGSSDTKSITITKATAVIDVTAYDVTFDGDPHTATGSATGVQGEDLSADLDLSGTTHTNAGDYSGDTWTFIDSTGNYFDDAGTVDDAIAKASTSTVLTFEAGPYVYRGTDFTATAVVTGAGALNESVTVIYTDDCLNVTITDGCTATATFAGDANHTGSTDTKNITITKATAVIDVTPYNVTFDGDPHTATGTATGVLGEDLGLDLDLSDTTHTNAGTYNDDPWTFTDSTGNYFDDAGTVDDAIGQASSTTVVTFEGGPYVYRGTEFTATAVVTGAGSLNEAVLVVLSSDCTNVTTADGCTATATFAGDANHTGSMDIKSITILKADATIAVSGYTGVYDGDPHGSTGTATGVVAEALDGLDFGDVFTDVPGGTATWTFTDETGNYNDATGSVGIVISKADAAIVVNGFDLTYDATEHIASGSAIGVKGETLAGLDLSATAHTNAGSYLADPWSFTDVTGNYNDANGTVDDYIAKADATIVVNGSSGVYDALPHGATGTAKGVLDETLAGLFLGGSYTDVPGGTANWTFTDVTGNYYDDLGSVEIVISKANPTIVVTPYDLTYNALSHTATGTAKGVLDEDLAGLDLSGTTHTNAGDYATDGWTFTDVTGNYNDDAGTVHDSIAKADAVIDVTLYDVTYNGLSHTATGTATGVLDEALIGLDLSGTTHTNAGDYTGDAWTFTDVTGNYNDASGTVDDVIDKADATIAVSGYSGIYDAAAHGATGTATGVDSEALAGLDLGATFTNVRGGTATWTFTDETGNYNNASGSVAIVIGKADATIVVNGYSGVYDGDAHRATGTATGVEDESLLGLDLGNSFTNVPGGTATWTFIDVTGNYNDDTDTVEIVISQASSTTVVTCPASVTYNGSAQTPCAVSVTGAGSLSLTPTPTYANNTDAGTASASYSYPGDLNHTGSNDSKTFTIAQRTLVVTAAGIDKVYNANTTATVTLSDDRVAGDALSVAYSATFNNKNVGENKPVSVFGIAISGPDAGNYTANTATSTTADITQRDLTVTANGVNKVYDGTTSATVTLATDKVSGDVVNGAYTGAAFVDKNVANGIAANVAGISISGADAANYHLTSTTAATAANITKKALTVKADNKVRTFGQANPPFTHLISGFVPGEVLATSGVTGAPVLSTVATPASPSGTYDIDVAQGTLAAQNYSFGLVKGTLTVSAYTVIGFTSPVDNLPTLNVAKAGQAIPLKWRVLDHLGNPVTNIASVGSMIGTMSCGSIATDLIEEFSAGSSGLINQGNGYYQFNWKTPTSYANTCKTFVLTLGDGATSHLQANFQFKK